MLDPTVIRLLVQGENCSISKTYSVSYCQFRKIIFENNSMENTFWFLYCHFMLPRQSYIQIARFVLSPHAMANSSKVIFPASYCRPDSRKHKKQDMNCHPGSQPTAQIRLILLPTVDQAVANANSKICTVDQNHGQQYRSDNFCSRLSTRQSQTQNASYELSRTF